MKMCNFQTKSTFIVYFISTNFFIFTNGMYRNLCRSRVIIFYRHFTIPHSIISRENRRTNALIRFRRNLCALVTTDAVVDPKRFRSFRYKRSGIGMKTTTAAVTIAHAWYHIIVVSSHRTRQGVRGRSSPAGTGPFEKLKAINKSVIYGRR